MDHFKTNIALIPKATGAEKTIGAIIIALMFVPFAIGIFSENKRLLLSLPAAFVLLFIFNLVSKEKFNHRNWVQKDFFVEFTLSGVKIISSTGQKEFLWTAMRGTQLQVRGFDGEVKPGEDESGHYNGTENRLTFHAHNRKYELNFYLKNAEQKQALKLFLQNIIAPDTHLTFQEQQEIYSADINSFKEVLKESEPTGQKKSIKSMGCLVLFITPFVLIGIGTFGLALYQFGKVAQARNWTPVHAKVLSVEMVSSSDSESTSYKVEMKYKYSVSSQTFMGSSVSFNSGMNNIEHYGELYNVLNQSQVIQIYVNENDPAESVVIRGITNAMIGMLIFSIMWNSLLLTFLLPALNRKLEMKKVLIVTLVMWALGIGKFIFQVGDIDISTQVSVIEAKEGRK
ncbi:DUF3592 domain-containing protein [Ohtaekwangia kribbensis]|uniref:DUF3592 domain-containing protein n=1 Tax=Ohtaekwangia kribbensis TaxID=688913 RepID=A0ABW3K5Q6_9BACT